MHAEYVGSQDIKTVNGRQYPYFIISEHKHKQAEHCRYVRNAKFVGHIVAGIRKWISKLDKNVVKILVKLNCTGRKE